MRMHLPCIAKSYAYVYVIIDLTMDTSTKCGCITVTCCQDDQKRSVPHSGAHDATATARYPMLDDTIVPVLQVVYLMG